MKEFLNQLPADTVVVLHACCHNPTGADMTNDQWKEVVSICATKNLIPFLDMAYQGFADGIYEDGIAVRLFAESGLSFFISSSFSKSFSLYGERVGALTIVTQSADESKRVASQVKKVIRTNYSYTWWRYRIFSFKFDRTQSNVGRRISRNARQN